MHISFVIFIAIVIAIVAVASFCLGRHICIASKKNSQKSKNNNCKSRNRSHPNFLFLKNNHKKVHHQRDAQNNPFDIHKISLA